MRVFYRITFLLVQAISSRTTPNLMRNTSPNDVPPSPNSVGSNSSLNGPSNNPPQNLTSTQLNELQLLREAHSKSKSFFMLNDYNIRSQLCWDTNEKTINDDKQLSGSYFCCFRRTFKIRNQTV